MPKLTLTINIGQPVKDVFAFIVNPANTPKWVETVIIEETSTEPVALGTIYRNQNRAGVWSEYEVTAFEPPKVFILTKSDGSRMVYRFTPIDATTTQLEYTWTTNGQLDEPFLQQILSKLKTVMEGD